MGDENHPFTNSHIDGAASPATTSAYGQGRAKTLQIRLSPSEFGCLQRQAEEQNLPISTLAREILMCAASQGNDAPDVLIARLRHDLNTLASKVERLHPEEE